MFWVKIVLLGIHLKVSAVSIQLLEFAQCTAHLNGVLAKVQARFCIDMPLTRECTSGTINRYMKKFLDYKFVHNVTG